MTPQPSRRVTWSWPTPPNSRSYPALAGLLVIILLPGQKSLTGHQNHFKWYFTSIHSPHSETLLLNLNFFLITQDATVLPPWMWLNSPSGLNFVTLQQSQLFWERAVKHNQTCKLMSWVWASYTHLFVFCLKSASGRTVLTSVCLCSRCPGAACCSCLFPRGPDQIERFTPEVSSSLYIPPSLSLPLFFYTSLSSLLRPCGIFLGKPHLSFLSWPSASAVSFTLSSILPLDWFYSCPLAAI